MKHRAHQNRYINNSGFKNNVSTLVAVRITYDQQQMTYKFQEKKQVPGTRPDTPIISKHLIHTGANGDISDQAVSPSGANFISNTTHGHTTHNIVFFS